MADPGSTDSAMPKLANLPWDPLCGVLQFCLIWPGKHVVARLAPAPKTGEGGTSLPHRDTPPDLAEYVSPCPAQVHVGRA